MKAAEKRHVLRQQMKAVVAGLICRHFTTSDYSIELITYAVQCTCGKFGSFSMIITTIVAHCTDSTQCLHPLPLKFYLLFWHYSAMLEHTYYSQNYASIIGQGLGLTLIGALKLNLLCSKHAGTICISLLETGHV